MRERVLASSKLHHEHKIFAFAKVIYLQYWFMFLFFFNDGCSESNGVKFNFNRLVWDCFARIIPSVSAAAGSSCGINMSITSILLNLRSPGGCYLLSRTCRSCVSPLSFHCYFDWFPVVILCHPQDLYRFSLRGLLFSKVGRFPNYLLVFWCISIMPLWGAVV